MKFARINSDGMALIIEEFSSLLVIHEGIRNQFVQVDDTILVGNYYIDGDWIGVRPSEFHNIVSGEWVEDTATKNATLAQRQLDSALNALKSNRNFGVSLVDTFAVENVSLGINASQTDAVMVALLPTLTALSNGYLETAIRRVRELNPALFDGVFLSEARLLSYVNRIESYLGLTLSTEL